MDVYEATVTHPITGKEVTRRLQAESPEEAQKMLESLLPQPDTSEMEEGGGIVEDSSAPVKTTETDDDNDNATPDLTGDDGGDSASGVPVGGGADADENGDPRMYGRPSEGARRRTPEQMEQDQRISELAAMFEMDPGDSTLTADQLEAELRADAAK